MKIIDRIKPSCEGIGVWFLFGSIGSDYRQTSEPKIHPSSSKNPLKPPTIAWMPPLPHEIGRRRVGTQMFILMYCIFLQEFCAKLGLEPTKWQLHKSFSLVIFIIFVSQVMKMSIHMSPQLWDIKCHNRNYIGRMLGNRHFVFQRGTKGFGSFPRKLAKVNFRHVDAAKENKNPSHPFATHPGKNITL